jgi:hypothetical protein
VMHPDEDDDLALVHIPVHDLDHPSPDAGRPVLSIRSRVPVAEISSFTRDALRDVRRHIEDHHGRVEGPPFSILHHASPTHVDLEVGWPVRHVPSAGRIATGTVPPCLIRRSTEHHAVA